MVGASVHSNWDTPLDVEGFAAVDDSDPRAGEREGPRVAAGGLLFERLAQVPLDVESAAAVDDADPGAGERQGLRIAVGSLLVERLAQVCLHAEAPPGEETMRYTIECGT